MTHLIRQQYLHVDLVGSESDGLALQQSLPALCRNWMTPAMERALDRCAPADCYLSIERIEVDAGIFSLEELETRLADSVAQALERTLREQLHRNSAESPVAERCWREKVEESLGYFLATGTLPWSFRLPAGTSLEDAVLRCWDELPPGHRPTVAALLSTLASATARARLVRQFSPRFLTRLMAIISPAGTELVAEVLDAAARLPALPAPGNQLTRTVWEEAFAAVAGGSAVTRGRLVAAVRDALPLAARRDTALAAELERLFPAILASGQAPGSSVPQAGESAAALSRVSPATAADGHPEAQSGLFLENAGVILLHPFLPAFFEALLVARDDQLLDPERALCLLHFLVTGQTMVPEHDVALLKILCNLALTEPIAAEVGLTAHEQEEGHALLRAVICHWDSLRNSSPDGLRGTFLLRPGKLSRRYDGDWLLQVEPQTCDILLDQLPWEISMIKLPWMKKMLWVEWR